VRERASIKDVAALAGVSFKTVSRVVNGVDTVLPELRARVEAAVAELDYVPNSAARSLKSGSGDAIGIVVDSIDDVFFATLVRAVEDRALELGLAVIASSTGYDAQRERDQLTLLAGRHVRGIILAPVGDHSDFLVPRRKTLPVVMIDRSVPGFDSVTVDDYGAAQRAVERLVASGHHRIALVGFDERLQTARRRRDAYVDVLARIGKTPDPQLIPEVPQAAEAVRPVVKALLALPDPPTALFVANARHAIAVVSVLHELDRRDVAMVSFGSFALADVVDPPVTCIDQDASSIGNMAFDRLVELFDHPSAKPQHQIAPTVLVEQLSHAIGPPDRTAQPSARRRKPGASRPTQKRG
jgi:LacI family transcriptional regulator